MWGILQIFEYPFYFVPWENDVLSMEMEFGFRDIFLVRLVLMLIILSLLPPPHPQIIQTNDSRKTMLRSYIISRRRWLSFKRSMGRFPTSKGEGGHLKL